MSDTDLLDLLGEEEGDVQDDPKQDLTELKSMVEDLKKENGGLLQAKQEEKRKRQDNQRRLESIEDKLNDILGSRSKVDTTIESKGQKTIDGIPVNFTPDGEAFIPKDKLNEWSKPYQQKISDLEKSLETTTSKTEAARKADQIITQVLGEDERFPAVYSNYQKARAWINDRVISYQQDNGLTGHLSSAQVLDVVVDDDLDQQFQDKFPGMDLETVTVAEDSTRLFKKMLKTHLPVGDIKNNNDDQKRFEKVLKKPSGLGDSRNAKNELGVMDRLSALTQDDIMGLSDKQVRELEKALREDELRG